MKRIVYCLTLIILLTSLNFPAAYAQPLDISAPNAILMDYATGNIIYDHNAHVKTFPASTTKVLTALIALETLDLNEVITVDYDSYVLGSSMYLMKGESFTVEELINALMIRSANDVAELLAIRISGSVEEFAKLMNQRARELGALNSNFTNPHGLPDDNHITTAHDLAIITKHALKLDKFREIMSTVNIQYEPTEETPEIRYFRNSNKFLWGTGGANQILYKGHYVDIKYDIIDGVKTGYTPEARNCLISSSIKNNHRLISVVLGAGPGEVYSDSRKLIDYGYENFKLISLVDGNKAYKDVNVKSAKLNKTSLYPKADTFALVPIDMDESLITTKVDIKKNIKAPLDKGTVLGHIEFIYNSKVLASVGLINVDEIQAKALLFRILTISNIFKLIITLFVLWQSLVIYLRLSSRKIKKFSSRRYGTNYRFGKGLFK